MEKVATCAEYNTVIQVARALMTASPLNGILTVRLDHETEVKCVDLNLIWTDEDGDAYVDVAGYTWLAGDRELAGLARVMGIDPYGTIPALDF